MYVYKFKNGQRTNEIALANGGDLIYPDKWTIIDDTLNFRSYKYLIVSYSVDSVTLKSPVGNDTLRLVRNCTIQK
jgi:hypothetical protein